jgi:hypothetical protein
LSCGSTISGNAEAVRERIEALTPEEDNDT